MLQVEVSRGLTAILVDGLSAALMTSRFKSKLREEQVRKHGRLLIKHDKL